MLRVTNTELIVRGSSLSEDGTQIMTMTGNYRDGALDFKKSITDIDLYSKNQELVEEDQKEFESQVYDYINTVLNAVSD